ncbi:hypothetical protein Sme01_60530 [Sphaerisporangium melleum]|uniref:Uncharacterized protein n=1 Tax=Sphaerisporangium melleum TaxID=321316 RepID=A0A917VM76_9ACTN|nr:hypothetical protein [Sphaerisporangium melleum]GGK99316.1 hypothetical protein GCM10007964_46720 [Sphaerisporangium melleum]GII73577.1 hypothetical protein Sme01_60530 [Sphaerisporangium melleum]
MTLTVRRVTFRVSRERALDLDADVWYAGPVNAPIRSGVSAATLAELRSAVEAVKHFVLGVSEDTPVTVEYLYDLPGVPAEVWRANRELRERLCAAGLSEDDQVELLLTA